MWSESVLDIDGSQTRKEYKLKQVEVEEKESVFASVNTYFLSVKESQPSLS